MVQRSTDTMSGSSSRRVCGLFGDYAEGSWLSEIQMLFTATECEDGIQITVVSNGTNRRLSYLDGWLTSKPFK